MANMETFSKLFLVSQKFNTFDVSKAQMCFRSTVIQPMTINKISLDKCLCIHNTVTNSERFVNI